MFIHFFCLCPLGLAIKLNFNVWKVSLTLASIHQLLLFNNIWGLFLEGPEKFSHPKSRSRMSNIMTSGLFYGHTLNTSRRSLHTRTFSRIHRSVFKYRLTKNGFAHPKSFRGFRETGLWPEKGGPFGWSLPVHPII